MTLNISDGQKQYLKEQLRYDHVRHLPPPNTLVVHDLQHELIRKAVQSFAAQQPVHMLDMGCGWGDFSEILDPFLQSYVGIEPSLIELKQFNRRPNRSLVRGVGEYLDFLKSRSRNFILLNSVLDHGFDPHLMFSNCLRILAPGGLIIISMENSEKVPVQLRKFLGLHHEHEGHLSFWGVDEVNRLLEREFEILEWRTLGFLFGFHQLTSVVPLPLSLLRTANHLANASFGRLSPKGGHILFFAARRKGNSPPPQNLNNPFCCPNCKTEVSFGTPHCPQCNLVLAYINGGILDSLEFNPALKSQLNAT